MYIGHDHIKLLFSVSRLKMGIEQRKEEEDITPSNLS